MLRVGTHYRDVLRPFTMLRDALPTARGPSSLRRCMRATPVRSTCSSHAIPELDRQSARPTLTLSMDRRTSLLNNRIRR